MSNANVTIRMDRELKHQADVVLEDLGMSFTTAVNVFARQVVRERRIPIEITAAPRGVDDSAVDAAMSFAERHDEDFDRMAK